MDPLEDSLANIDAILWIIAGFSNPLSLFNNICIIPFLARARVLSVSYVSILVSHHVNTLFIW